MRRLFLALLLLAAPAQAATRIYFGNQNVNDDQGERIITPAADAGWEDASAIARTTMHIGTPFRARNQLQIFREITLTPSSANQDIDFQFQMALDAGITFTSGVTTVTAQFGVVENPNTSDVTQVIIGLRVIDDDGTTVNATLLSVANYGTTTEMDDTLGSTRNKTVANGDTVQATYTTVAGDWLVLEVGYQNDGATGAVSRARSGGLADGMGYQALQQTAGAPAAATDCPVNETTLRCISWIEFSNTITSPGDPNPGPTRLYFPATTAADVTPSAFQAADWTRTDEVTYQAMNHVKGSSAMAEGTQIDWSSAPTSWEIDRVLVSNPMVAGAVFTAGQTSVTGQILMRELDAADNLYGAAAKLWISNEAGTSLLAELYRFPFVVATVELGTTFGNRPFLTGSVVSTSYTTTGGERLILELGGVQLGYAATSPIYAFLYGENASDCAGPRTVVVSGSADCAPWIEFSNAITFTTDAATYLPRLPFFGRFLMASPVELLRKLTDFWRD